MAITLRAQRPADDADVRAVLTAAFADDGRVADLAEALRRRTDRHETIVAVEDDEVLGVVHLSASWVDAPARLVDVLTLSPLAVAPAHRSRGIGSRLLAEAVAAAEAMGVPLMFLEGDPAYYSRRGWRAAAEFGFTRPSERIPVAAFQVMPLSAYDRGSMRGALVYNDTFWSHDCVGPR